MTKQKRKTDPKRTLLGESKTPRNASTASEFSTDHQNGESNPENQPKTKRGHLASLFVETLKEYSKNLAIASGAITIGTLAFFLTPLKDKIAHLLWEEKAEILITVNSERIREGNSLSLNLIVTPQSSIEVSEGVLSFDYSENNLALVSGERTFNTPRIKTPVVLPENSRLNFIGIKPGSAEINLKLITKYGTYQAKKEIEVEASTTMGKPSRSNLSGEWNIRMGLVAGKMELLDKGGKISGTYYFDTGQTGVIGGIRDGTTFLVTFYKGASPSKWAIDANYKPNEEFLEITGHADLYQANETGWKRIGDSSSFYATAHLYIEGSRDIKRTK